MNSDTNNLQTPGVYIVEQDAFPSSVVEVPTAIPAFLGYTEFAVRADDSLTEPLLINSMAEFQTHFGGAPPFKYPIVKVDASDGEAPASYDVKIENNYYQIGEARPGNAFYLYFCLQLFYQNGGGPCYIVSVGNYVSEDPGKNGDPAPTIPSKDDFLASLDQLSNLGGPKPTMILAPDSLLLSQMAHDTVQEQILMQCGESKDRIGIVEIYRGFESNDAGNVIDTFRTGIGNRYLNYGAAYYPFLNTSIVGLSDVSDANVDPGGTALTDLFEEGTTDVNSNADYRNLMEAIVRKANVLPPGPAMAGVMTRIDGEQGVWVAPANVNLDSVVSPTVSINNDEQAGLNVDVVAGKSINAIRSFPGRGEAVVWGARTLDGNSLDWRYLSVRRTMIMIEQSIQSAAVQFVFAENNASTWRSVERMIGSFLHTVWTAGGLPGPSASDSYDVSVGLGKTMTPVDVQEGIMRIAVKVAVVHPAEFLLITFEQKMAGNS